MAKPQTPDAPDVSQAMASAAAEFGRHDTRRDGTLAVAWLDQGLTILRNSLFLRMHRDVELFVGRDSMLMPVSELKSMFLVNQAIELYQIAESAAGAKQLGYVADPEVWYLDWLAHIRLSERDWSGPVVERTKEYSAMTDDLRRSAFVDEMGRLLHESVAAPLVLFRLLPPAIRIATARAFDDPKTADALRSQQIALLPSIADCRQCRGQVLGSGEQCPKCGNPLWTYEWLTATD
jgi:hypothetical protein